MENTWSLVKRNSSPGWDRGRGQWTHTSGTEMSSEQRGASTYWALWQSLVLFIFLWVPWRKAVMLTQEGTLAWCPDSTNTSPPCFVQNSDNDFYPHLQVNVLGLSRLAKMGQQLRDRVRVTHSSSFSTEISSVPGNPSSRVNWGRWSSSD